MMKKLLSVLVLSLFLIFFIWCIKKLGMGYEPQPFVKEGSMVINTIGMKLVYIPPGEFMMGSPPDEKGRQEDEGPQHLVQITKGFYMGIYEVTQDQWQKIMKKTARKQRNMEGRSFPLRGEGDNLPI